MGIAQQLGSDRYGSRPLDLGSDIQHRETIIFIRHQLIRDSGNPFRHHQLESLLSE